MNMDEEEAKMSYEDLQRRREIVGGLLQRTRLEIEQLLETLKATAEPDPRDVQRLQLLTFQGRVLVNLMGTLADEAARFALDLKNQNENQRKAAPLIDPSEINVPDFLPEDL